MAKGAKDPESALASHAGSKDTLKFNEKILHPGLEPFQKGEVVRFENPAAAAYFDIAFNGTDFTDEEPTRTVTNDMLDFNPETEEAGVATIDPETTVGFGREGTFPGMTVAGVARGDERPSNPEPTLEVNDVHATVEAEEE